jgi:hypothetical protein
MRPKPHLRWAMHASRLLHLAFKRNGRRSLQHISNYSLRKQKKELMTLLCLDDIHDGPSSTGHCTAMAAIAPSALMPPALLTPDVGESMNVSWRGRRESSANYCMCADPQGRSTVRAPVPRGWKMVQGCHFRWGGTRCVVASWPLQMRWRTTRGCEVEACQLTRGRSMPTCRRS